MKMKDLEEFGDERLAVLAGRGEDDATARLAATILLGRYHERIYRWARRYVREHEEALDLAQEIMLSVWRYLPRYESRSRFYAWVFVIARNRCLNALRRPRLLVDEDAEPERLSAPEGDPGRALEEKLDEAEVLRLLEERLETVEQDALYLRCFERLPVETISAALAIPEASGARSVLQRARQKLRRALAERARSDPS